MSQDPIPWEELRAMPEHEQEAWWRDALTPSASHLLGKLVRVTGRSFTDCVVGLLGEEQELVGQLLRERKERRAAQGEAPAGDPLESLLRPGRGHPELN